MMSLLVYKSIDQFYELEVYQKMGMFSNYQILSETTPNNLSCAYLTSSPDSKLAPVAASKPFEEYSATGNLIGYFWHQGETLNLEFQIQGEIAIEPDAVVSTQRGVHPTVNTLGKINQRFYNVSDLKSWTCTAQVGANYIWDEDAVFTYPEESVDKIYISAETYLQDKEVEICLYNFMHEKIYSVIKAAAPTVVLNIDTELSKKLLRGVYYCSVKVFNSTMCTSIFNETDCTLSVK